MSHWQCWRGTAQGALSHYWTRPARGRRRDELQVAVNCAWVGELAVQMRATHARGVEPRRSHSVEEFCGALEHKRANDPLLPWLRSCDRQTSMVRLDTYLDHEREGIATSGLRLGHALYALPRVLATATHTSARAESKRWVDQLRILGERLQGGR